MKEKRKQSFSFVIDVILKPKIITGIINIFVQHLR